MIRFVDLRGADTSGRFAFFDTVTCRFVDGATGDAWQDWDDFVDDTPPIEVQLSLDRFRRLCPPWVFAAPVEADDSEPEETPC